MISCVKFNVEIPLATITPPVDKGRAYGVAQGYVYGY